MQDIIDSIRAAVSTGGIPKQEIASEAGIHRNSLADVEKEKWNPRIKTVQAIVDAIAQIRARRA